MNPRIVVIFFLLIALVLACSLFGCEKREDKTEEILSGLREVGKRIDKLLVERDKLSYELYKRDSIFSTFTSEPFNKPWARGYTPKYPTANGYTPTAYPAYHDKALGIGIIFDQQTGEIKELLYKNQTFIPKETDSLSKARKYIPY